MTTQQTHGTIIDIDETNRIIKIQTRKDQKNLYFQRAMFARYLKYLDYGNRLFVKIEVKKPTKKLHKYTVLEIHRIISYNARKATILYSQEALSKGTQSFINNLKTKMFLDIEMSMHPYKFEKDFMQEVIQVGYVLTDEADQVIEKYMTFIQPTLYKTLTKRTLKFLDLTQEDVDQGIEFKTFYKHFKNVIETHQPAIIVWGKNDHIVLNDAYKINQVPSLHHLTRFVNLLQLHKNVYGLKDDLGLANAYKLYGYEMDNQRHDALEDAMMTFKIFKGFKAVLNGTKSIPLSSIK